MAQINEKNPTVLVKDAVRLTGLSIHMITYLGRIELLKPSNGGRGRARRFSFSDILFLRLIADLLKQGIEVKRLRHSLKKLHAQSDQWIDIRNAPSRFLVTDGTELFIRREGELESKTLNGQLAFAFVLDLKFSHREIAAAWPHELKATTKRRVRR